MVNHVDNVQMVKLDAIKLNPKNRNIHPKKQIDALCEIIKYQGFRQPLVVSNRSGLLVAGHGRYQAAQQLNYEQVPVVYQDFDSDEQEYAFLTADNAIALWAKLDIKSIQLDIKDFPELKLERLGIEKLQSVDGFARDNGGAAADLTKEPTANPGDLWILGSHRIFCGDSTSPADFKKLLDGEQADTVFTSPPYNVGISYNGYDDKKTNDEYMEMMTAVIRNCFNAMKAGRLIGWNVGVSPKSKPYHHAIRLEDAGFKLFRHIVWKKTGAQIPLWQNAKKNPVARNYMPNYNHEMVYMMVKGELEHGAATDMPEDLSMDVWDVSQFAAGGNNHPAAFPVHLAEMAIKVMTAPGEIALEPFGGSGSTIIACEKSGRRCFAMEIDPHYVDVAVARWEKFTGKRAQLVGGK